MKNLRMLSMVLLLLFSTPAWGAFLDWTNAMGTQDFTDPCNWSATPVPTVDSLQVNMTGDDAAILWDTAACVGLRVGNATDSDGWLEIESGADLTVGASDIKVGDISGYKGTINMTGGLFTGDGTGCYATFGTDGDGYLNISGGTWSSDRITLGEKAGDIGQIVLSSSGTLNLADDLKGATTAGGTFKVKLIGSNATFTIGDDIRNLDGDAHDSIFEFVLNGASGVGTGIVVGDAIGLTSYTEIDLSFVGASVDGTYTLMKAGGAFTDPGGLLSAASIAAGWSYELVTVGDYIELQATIPEPATISLLLVGGLATLMRRKK